MPAVLHEQQQVQLIRAIPHTLFQLNIHKQLEQKLQLGSILVIALCMGQSSLLLWDYLMEEVLCFLPVWP